MPRHFVALDAGALPPQHADYLRAIAGAGLPVQLLGILLARFPGPPVDRVGAALRRIRIGDLRKYGVEPAAWEPSTAKRPPVIDAGFLRELKLGRVEVRRAVVRLTPAGADFADGTTGAFDVVIAATGFRTTLPRILDLPGD